MGENNSPLIGENMDTLKVSFEDLIKLLQKYIAEQDFIMAVRTSQLITEECLKRIKDEEELRKY